MPLSSPDRSLVLPALATFVAAAALGLGLLLVAYRSGALDVRGLAIAAAVLVAGLTLAAALLAATVGRRLMRTLWHLRMGTELMTTVNPEFRISVAPDDQLAELGRQINRLAESLGEARSGLEREVARATGELMVERGKLRAVLEALGEGVTVATADGVVTLANPAAHDLLGVPMGGLLGRSLFDVVDREKLRHYLDRLRTTAGESERFTLHPGGGAILGTVMTPFFDDGHRVIGFVLVLRDVTQPARSAEERRRLLADTLRELRGPLSSVRSLSESLLRDPGLTVKPVARLVEAIHAEAVRLSHLVRTIGEAPPLAIERAPWHFESITFRELAAITLKRLEQDGVPPTILDVDAAPARPPFRAEVSALTAVLAHVVRVALGRRRTDGTVWLRPREVGGVLQIDVGTEGQGPLPAVEAELDVALPLPSGERATARDVVQAHAGEVWAYDDSGRIGFRIMLPRAEPTAALGRETRSRSPRFSGAGLRSGAASGEAERERPDLYDFSLFEEMARYVLPEARDRRLDELTCMVFDLETTGLRPENGDRIVSIGAVRVRGGAVRGGETFDALVNPRRPIPASSTRFHGVTDAMVADAPPIDVVLPVFLRFTEGAVLVGHQVWFDVRFLAAEAGRLGLPPITLGHPVLDTLALSEVVHGGRGPHGLDAIAERLGVVVQARHSALGDALATAEIFVRLIELLKARGITTLGQAIDVARERERARAHDITPGSGP